MPNIDIWEKRQIIRLRRYVLSASEDNLALQNKIYFEYLKELATKYGLKSEDGRNIDVNVNSMLIFTT